MNGLNVQAFLGRAAETRVEVFGATVRYRGVQYAVALGGVREVPVQDESGGMRLERRAVARVLLSAGMNPAAGQVMEVVSSPTGSVDGKGFRIVSVTGSPVNPELVLELEEVVSSLR